MSNRLDGDLLAAWDRAGAEAPLQRALTLLVAAWPGTARDEWAQLAIGERDRQLLLLRERLFGSRIDALASCPACGEALELAFESSQIALPASAAQRAFVLEVDGYRLTCRTLDSTDLQAAAEAPADQAGALLLARCVSAAEQDGDGGKPVAPAALPAPVRAAVEQALRDADPQADISIALACPACAHSWDMAFDVLAYLWSEIDDWAARLLGEVHALASAYGWSERAVLAMGTARRRRYLALIAGQAAQ